METRPASLDDLPELTRLFDAYRVFPPAERPRGGRALPPRALRARRLARDRGAVGDAARRLHPAPSIALVGLLYEAVGYVRDTAFHRYDWAISRPAPLT
jgi:hypothetical protein